MAATADVADAPVTPLARAVVLLLSAVHYVTAARFEDDLYLPTLHRACMHCLCEAATSCNGSIGCVDGYCGPLKISHIFWKEAGEIVLPNDDVGRNGAYEDCARVYFCAAKIVTSYMAKLGKDCNGDGVINCDDYAMIHFNGGYSCTEPLERNEYGQRFQRRYLNCRPPDDDDDPLAEAVLS